MRPTLRQLEYFVEVADRRAFGQAADALNVTQPSLSKQIAALEADLGVALFERSSRSVRLTQAGASLLDDARAVLEKAQAFRASASRLAQAPSDRLLAGVLPSIGAYFMPRLRDRLQARMLDLRISLIEGGSRDLLARLDAGEVDFVIASRSHLSGFEARPLFEETLWLCAAADDPLMQSGAPAPLSAIQGRTLLTLSPDFHLRWIVQQLAAKAGAEISADYSGASLDAVRLMAKSGDGVAILPSLYALNEARRDPSFKLRRIDHPDAIHPVFLYWRKSTTRAALFEQLGEAMVAEKSAIHAERAENFQD
jgi:LysR family hydrogen peroxide-inducible transcriptional activator